MKIQPTSGPIYYVATNEDASIIHHGHKELDQQVETGMKNCVCLDTEEDYIAELTKYNIVPEID